MSTDTLQDLIQATLSLNTGLDPAKSTPTLKADDTLVRRHWTDGSQHDYKYEPRHIKLEEKGRLVEDHPGMLIPKAWSKTAAQMIVTKYFRKKGIPLQVLAIPEPGIPAKYWRSEAVPGSPLTGEHSAHQVFHRLAGVLAYHGIKNKILTPAEADTLYDEYINALYYQRLSPNTPFMINAGLNWAYGITGEPQGYYHVDPDTKEGKLSEDQYTHLNSSACFILEPHDSLLQPNGIADLIRQETAIFRSGAGSGMNVSRIRAKHEPISHGGFSSGLLSFLGTLDRNALSIQSGGTTRRAAKMLTNDLDHPDVEEYVDVKPEAEAFIVSLVTGSNVLRKHLKRIDNLVRKHDLKKPNTLNNLIKEALAAGIPSSAIKKTILVAQNKLENYVEYPAYTQDFDSLAISLAPFQQANNSLRMPDEFLKAVDEDKQWALYRRTELVQALKENRDPNPIRLIPAKKLFRKINEAAWYSADPGLQFDTTLNAWNNIPAEGRFRASNPCVDADTPILTGQGWLTAAAVHAQHHSGITVQIATWDGTTGTTDPVTKNPSTTWTPLRNAYNNGAKPTIQLTLSDGRKLTLTPDHKIWTKAGYKAAKDLNDADLIPLPVEIRPEVKKLFPRLDATGNETTYATVIQQRVSRHDSLVFDFAESRNASFIAAGIPVSNCSEHTSIDNTSCSLAAANVIACSDNKEQTTDNYDTPSLRQAASLCTVALEIALSASHFPTKAIAETTDRVRPIGVGHANIGALLMRSGLPYDSPEARDVIQAITGILHMNVAKTSAHLAARLGPHRAYTRNREAHIRVNYNHALAALRHLNPTAPYLGLNVEPYTTSHTHHLYRDLEQDTHTATRALLEYGQRHHQLTLLQPTGTTGLMMDCDTLGIEPQISLKAIKNLVGGGTLSITSNDLTRAIRNLGYTDTQRTAIEEHITTKGHAEGAPYLKPEHYAVFDTAIAPKGSNRAISPEGHILAMAAAQPMLSAAISKTVNLPATTTVEDVEKVHRLAHSHMVKCIALYVDGCKAAQPLNTATDDIITRTVKTALDELEQERLNPVKTEPPTHREKLPDQRRGLVQKLKVGGVKVYVKTGEYPDGRLAEVFINVSRTGSSLRAVMDLWATTLSIGMQHRIPLSTFTDSMLGANFLPAGVVQGHPRIKLASSIVDAVLKYLVDEYGSEGNKKQTNAPVDPTIPENFWVRTITDTLIRTDGEKPTAPPVLEAETSTPVPPPPDGFYEGFCSTCGGNTVRSGPCQVCMNCARSTGCSG